MHQPVQNKMAGQQPGIRYPEEGGAYYVNRCPCGGLVDVPASGETVRCTCGIRHRWPRWAATERRRSYGAHIVPVKNPNS